jgi:hypothetical protein
LGYWRLRGKYDLVIQSDYKAIIGLSWLKSRLLFINNEEFCERFQPKLSDVWFALKRWMNGRNLMSIRGKRRKPNIHS